MKTPTNSDPTLALGQPKNVENACDAHNDLAQRRLRGDNASSAKDADAQASVAATGYAGELEKTYCGIEFTEDSVRFPWLGDVLVGGVSITKEVFRQILPHLTKWVNEPWTNLPPKNAVPLR